METQKKLALIVGVANERSLAWAIAKELAQEKRYQLFLTYQTPALERRVVPLAKQINASVFGPCDLTEPGHLEHLKKALEQEKKPLKTLVHSVAFAPKEALKADFINISKEHFLKTIEISTYSFLALVQKCAPLMIEGGTILTLTYEGSKRVIPNYHIMGVAKAALEASMRYLAYELGPKNIRVHAISPGPVKTLAAMGIRNFKTMLQKVESTSPLETVISAKDVGALARFLCSEEASHMTGSVISLDAGTHLF